MGKKGQDQRTVSVKTMRLEPGAKQGLTLLEDGINGHFMAFYGTSLKQPERASE